MEERREQKTIEGFGRISSRVTRARAPTEAGRFIKIRLVDCLLPQRRGATGKQ